MYTNLIYQSRGMYINLKDVLEQVKGKTDLSGTWILATTEGADEFLVATGKVQISAPLYFQTTCQDDIVNCSQWQPSSTSSPRKYARSACTKQSCSNLISRDERFCTESDPFGTENDETGTENDSFVSNMMTFVLKTNNFVSNTMTFVLKTNDFVSNTMTFVLKTNDLFVLKAMDCRKG